MLNNLLSDLDSELRQSEALQLTLWKKLEHRDCQVVFNDTELEDICAQLRFDHLLEVALITRWSGLGKKPFEKVQKLLKEYEKDDSPLQPESTDKQKDDIVSAIFNPSFAEMYEFCILNDTIKEHNNVEIFLQQVQSGREAYRDFLKATSSEKAERSSVQNMLNAWGATCARINLSKPQKKTDPHAKRQNVERPTTPKESAVGSNPVSPTAQGLREARQRVMPRKLSDSGTATQPLLNKDWEKAMEQAEKYRRDIKELHEKLQKKADYKEQNEQLKYTIDDLNSKILDKENTIAYLQEEMSKKDSAIKTSINKEKRHHKERTTSDAQAEKSLQEQVALANDLKAQLKATKKGQKRLKDEIETLNEEKKEIVGINEALQQRIESTLKSLKSLVPFDNTFSREASHNSQMSHVISQLKKKMASAEQIHILKAPQEDVKAIIQRLAGVLAQIDAKLDAQDLTIRTLEAEKSVRLEDFDDNMADPSVSFLSEMERQNSLDIGSSYNERNLISADVFKKYRSKQHQELMKLHAAYDTMRASIETILPNVQKTVSTLQDKWSADRMGSDYLQTMNPSFEAIKAQLVSVIAKTQSTQVSSNSKKTTTVDNGLPHVLSRTGSNVTTDSGYFSLSSQNTTGFSTPNIKNSTPFPSAAVSSPSNLSSESTLLVTDVIQQLFVLREYVDRMQSCVNQQEFELAGQIAHILELKHCTIQELMQLQENTEALDRRVTDLEQQNPLVRLKQRGYYLLDNLPRLISHRVVTKAIKKLDSDLDHYCRAQIDTYTSQKDISEIKALIHQIEERSALPRDDDKRASVGFIAAPWTIATEGTAYTPFSLFERKVKCFKWRNNVLKITPLDKKLDKIGSQLALYQESLEDAQSVKGDCATHAGDTPSILEMVQLVITAVEQNPNLVVTVKGEDAIVKQFQQHLEAGQVISDTTFTLCVDNPRQQVTLEQKAAVLSQMQRKIFGDSSNTVLTHFQSCHPVLEPSSAPIFIS